MPPADLPIPQPLTDLFVALSEYNHPLLEIGHLGFPHWFQQVVVSHGNPEIPFPELLYDDFRRHRKPEDVNLDWL